MLRSNVTDWSPKDLSAGLHPVDGGRGSLYVHKSDLAIRPCASESRAQAHILVCFLTYVLWKTLAASAVKRDWATNRGKSSKPYRDRAGGRALPTRAGTVIRKRCISSPPSINRSCFTARAELPTR